MLNRFQKIRADFGTLILVRLIFLPIALIVMSVVSFYFFASFLVGIIALVGLILGALLKKPIAAGAEYYEYVVPAGLFVYSVVLFLGDRLGFENNTKLAIIAATTVIVFDLQFWSLSDPSVVNAKEDID